MSPHRGNEGRVTSGAAGWGGVGLRYGEGVGVQARGVAAKFFRAKIFYLAGVPWVSPERSACFCLRAL